MENNISFWQRPFVKVCTIALLALFMLIPLGMIRSRVSGRASRHNEAVDEITRNWGGPQTFSGPWISYSYLREVGKEKEKETVKASLYPDILKYEVGTVSKELHRTVFDVSVYTADVSIDGTFILDEHFVESGGGVLTLDIGDLKGIQGLPTVAFAGKDLKIKSEGKSLKAEVALDEAFAVNEAVPFHVSLKVNGAETLFFKPVGTLTEVEVTSDYPDPSFTGDFLPVERDVRPDGFNAKWQVSQITLSGQTSDIFGVRLANPVTQYRQTERATKYGILVILLVFIAGFVVEMLSKKPISLIQYLVIGASLALFYSLLLAFSDFLSFGSSYLIASVMTVGALSAYFVGIVKNKRAYLLGGLVALMYGIIYVLLQMETYAFLAGTLLLFVILCVIMYLTRNLNPDGNIPE